MNNFKVWIVLFGLSSVLFLTLGLVLAVFDQDYFNSARFLIASGLNFYSFFKIKKLRPDLKPYIKSIYFGFILTGLGINFGSERILPDIVYYIGIFIFVVGIINYNLKIRKQNKDQ